MTAGKLRRALSIVDADLEISVCLEGRAEMYLITRMEISSDANSPDDDAVTLICAPAAAAPLPTDQR